MSVNPDLKQGVATEVINNIFSKLRAKKLDMSSSQSYHMKSLF